LSNNDNIDKEKILKGNSTQKTEEESQLRFYSD